MTLSEITSQNRKTLWNSKIQETKTINLKIRRNATVNLSRMLNKGKTNSLKVKKVRKYLPKTINYKTKANLSNQNNRQLHNNQNKLGNLTNNLYQSNNRKSAKNLRTNNSRKFHSKRRKCWKSKNNKKRKLNKTYQSQK